MRNNGEMLEYTFTSDKNNTDIIVNIPTRLRHDKFAFIENDIKQLDKLMIKANKVNTKRKIKTTLQTAAAAATLLLTLKGIKEVVDHRVKETNEPSIYDYYDGIMDTNDIYNMANKLQESAEKTLKK